MNESLCPATVVVLPTAKPHASLTICPIATRHRLQVFTGHVAYHPSVLSRIKPATYASVVFLREPLARLVSLFNMYPDGTFGLPPHNATSASARFSHAYRRRFEGRNALTCFVSGAALCDSVGALSRPGHAMSVSALRRARFNLAHRYDVFGLTERAEESMAVIAWVFGWLPLLERAPQLLTALHPQRQRRIVPGSEHRRLSLDELCAHAPRLVARMHVHERFDRLLYRFATVLYAQRLRHVPPEVLALAGTSQSSSPDANQSASQMSVPSSSVPLDFHLPPSCAAAEAEPTGHHDGASRSANMPIPEEDAVANA